MRPPIAVSPLAAPVPPFPFSKNPRASIAQISAIVKQS